MDLRFDASTKRLHGAGVGQEAVFLPWPDVRAFRRTVGGSDWGAFEPEFFPAVCNRQVSPVTSAAVRQWLDETRALPPPAPGTLALGRLF